MRWRSRGLNWFVRSWSNVCPSGRWRKLWKCTSILLWYEEAILGLLESPWWLGRKFSVALEVVWQQVGWRSPVKLWFTWSVGTRKLVSKSLQVVFRVILPTGRSRSTGVVDPQRARPGPKKARDASDLFFDRSS